ncbi:MAG TPA: VIT1/CCC1 transporter family protein [candidate division Zixibacteria bacterium]|nr:VIT1/CCC1 transporter family protein [candidate division Zixibacteria bacterium]
MASTGDRERWRANLQGEVDVTLVFHAMADGADDPRLADLYRRLAHAEERHARDWSERLGGLTLEPTRRARLLAWVARRLGPGLVAGVVSSHARAVHLDHEGLRDVSGTPLPPGSRSFARFLRSVPDGVEGSVIARFEGRHRTVSGNALRAAVLGANDGLVSNFSLVMGVAGAAPEGQAVLIAGLAGLLAGALSMALGEWLSVQSSRELAMNQLAVEAAELEAFPDQEREELRLIYQAKGIPRQEAERLATRLMESDRPVVLDTMAREELGIDPEELGGNPWVAAIASFSLFAGGAIIPVIPFLFGSGPETVATSTVLSGLALFGIGAGITVVTGQAPVRSGLRQLAFGLAAAAITFGVGSLLGTAVGQPMASVWLEP